MASVLATCRAAYETFLSRELVTLGATGLECIAPGVVAAKLAPEALAQPLLALVFARAVLLEPEFVQGAHQLPDAFVRALGDARVETAWPLHVGAFESSDRGVAAKFLSATARRLSRVAKLAEPTCEVGTHRGFCIVPLEAPRFAVSREFVLFGQQRMRMDSRAPSRSFLKLEEALRILGRAPEPRELVLDLGAAPGGWAYAAAKRGASVIAGMYRDAVPPL
eukprot:Amastigsp_a341215_6.p1 type:complete len:222 gc:universal Amastigsp_a341215_6:84-749(+)